MARTKHSKLLKEHELAKQQVEMFENKYKQYDTVWHWVLERTTAALDRLEQSKKKKTAKKKEVEKEQNDG